MASHLLAMEQVRAAKVLVSLARIFQAYLYRDVRCNIMFFMFSENLNRYQGKYFLLRNRKFQVGWLSRKYKMLSESTGFLELFKSARSQVIEIPKKKT